MVISRDVSSPQFIWSSVPSKSKLYVFGTACKLVICLGTSEVISLFLILVIAPALVDVTSFKDILVIEKVVPVPNFNWKDVPSDLKYISYVPAPVGVKSLKSEFATPVNPPLVYESISTFNLYNVASVKTPVLVIVISLNATIDNFPPLTSPVSPSSIVDIVQYEASSKVVSAKSSFPKVTSSLLNMNPNESYLPLPILQYATKLEEDV